MFLDGNSRIEIQNVVIVSCFAFFFSLKVAADRRDRVGFGGVMDIDPNSALVQRADCADGLECPVGSVCTAAQCVCTDQETFVYNFPYAGVTCPPAALSTSILETNLQLWKPIHF